ncbi:DUF1294 domain-containing protein [Thalassotalea aquiviva]|uniref:DUF1294 domain-containing protein n=1 Tax=Thalassotalea aquiviva TaxID=3242415 RepID=UPI00352A8F5A
MKRLKGKLIKWNADKGFGFIALPTGGPDVFIHISAFENKQRIPSVQDVITFSLSTDKRGRVCAVSATYSGEKLKKKEPQKANRFPYYLSIGFLLFIIGAYFSGLITINLLYIYFATSVITFIAYAIDKSKARQGLWRTKESTLHLLALAGGWPGAAIAQQALRHKSKKGEFRGMFWITALINVASLAWLLSDYGAEAYFFIAML